MADISATPFNVLNDQLPDGEVFIQGMAEYEAAISTGNLLYRMISPKAVVQVRSVEEVQATVRFAAQNNYHLTVKNGGHSYAAYCLNEGGIVLDLSCMHKVKIDLKQNTVTVQGGAIWKDVYSRLAELDPRKLVVGGQCPTVGVSGFTLGGGLSPFSRSYGLGIDSLLSMTLVTASGEVVTVGPNESDPDKKDLFWAVRGGGGGNFGVTVEIVSRLHDLNDKHGLVVCGNLGWNLSRSSERFKDMMRKFNEVEWPPELSIDALWHSDNGKDLVGEMTVLFNGPMSRCLDVIRPLLDFSPDINLREMKWMDWVNLEMQGGFGTTSKIYHHHVSFIFGHGAITPEFVRDVLYLLDEAKKLLSDKTVFPVLADDGCSKTAVHFLWDHMGGKTSQVKANDTAFFWRKGEYVANIKLSWSHPSQSSRMAEFEDMCKQVLGRYALDKVAAYVNYIDDTQKNWHEAYYGENYSRLVDIKNTWDPDNFWRFPQSIGRRLDDDTPARRHVAQVAFMHRAIPDRWDEFSVKNPEAIASAGNDIQRTLAANLATRQTHHDWRH
ncbi:putative FAD-linked oxidoreductase YvdP [Cladorrhinum sp. PSN259]|nr:putative FAD-linked oxidoreductase YvdP [Cladorrhinum sp. PSN259]